MEITTEVLDSHIDKLVDVINKVQEGKITVIVGNNGVGKSLIRKQMQVKFKKKYGDGRGYIRSVSMQQRTELRSDLGAFANVLHDDEDSPTSLWTYYLIENTFSLDESEKKYYYIFDELEMGMSAETILGVLKELEKKIPEFLENSLGIMVISHSSFVVSWFMNNYDCKFYNIGYNSVSTDYLSWRDRNYIPTDLDWLKEWSEKLRRRISERSKSV